MTLSKDYEILGEQLADINVEDYFKRINKYHKLEIVEVADSTTLEEEERIIKKLSTKSYKVALDIHGNTLSSIEFSTFIDKNLMN